MKSVDVGSTPTSPANSSSDRLHRQTAQKAHGAIGRSFYFRRSSMEQDSLLIQAIQANTTAMGTLTGVLLVFMGAFIFTICGYLCIRYTLRG